MLYKIFLLFVKIFGRRKKHHEVNLKSNDKPIQPQIISNKIKNFRGRFSFVLSRDSQEQKERYIQEIINKCKSCKYKYILIEYFRDTDEELAKDISKYIENILDQTIKIKVKNVESKDIIYCEDQIGVRLGLVMVYADYDEI